MTINFIQSNLKFSLSSFFFSHGISPVCIIRIKVGNKPLSSIFIVDSFPQTQVKIKGQGSDLWPQAPGLWTLSTTFSPPQTLLKLPEHSGSSIQLLLLHPNLSPPPLLALQWILYLLKGCVNQISEPRGCFLLLWVKFSIPFFHYNMHNGTRRYRHFVVTNQWNKSESSLKRTFVWCDFIG